MVQVEMEDKSENDRVNVYVKFVDEKGDPMPNLVQVPVQATAKDLNIIVNQMIRLNTTTTTTSKQNPQDDYDEDDDEKFSRPFSFYSFDENHIELRDSLATLLEESLKKSHEQRQSVPSLITGENIVQLRYEAQSVYRVKPVTRCTSSLRGHGQPVLSARFSPDGKHLASGSGDCTVRFWDLNTDTPKWTGLSHKDWVLAIAWSPAGDLLASGGKDGAVQLWHGNSTGKPAGAPLTGHKQWITALVWEPLHNVSMGSAPRLASASKDATVRIWDTVRRQCLFVLSQHVDAITSLAWAGNGTLFTGSRDRCIKAWNLASSTSNTNDSTLGKVSIGSCLFTLSGHAHWINSLTLSDDFLLRTGPFDPAPIDKNQNEEKENQDTSSSNYLIKRAQIRYQKSTVPSDRLVSASDDFTLFLWDLSNLSKLKPLARMTGHQAIVNHVTFSPDARIIASASFDKSIRLWNGRSGQHLSVLRGHVGPVYQISWSSDSRQLLSGSKDTTLKIWNAKTAKLKVDLPGHLDEIYAIDWSPAGDKVVSAGKDKLLKIWRN